MPSLRHAPVLLWGRIVGRVGGAGGPSQNARIPLRFSTLLSELLFGKSLRI
jgi:hypothetical protein